MSRKYQPQIISHSWCASTVWILKIFKSYIGISAVFLKPHTYKSSLMIWFKNMDYKCHLIKGFWLLLPIHLCRIWYIRTKIAYARHFFNQLIISIEDAKKEVRNCLFFIDKIKEKVVEQRCLSRSYLLLLLFVFYFF